MNGSKITVKYKLTALGSTNRIKKISKTGGKINTRVNQPRVPRGGNQNRNSRNLNTENRGNRSAPMNRRNNRKNSNQSFGGSNRFNNQRNFRKNSNQGQRRGQRGRGRGRR